MEIFHTCSAYLLSNAEHSHSFSDVIYPFQSRLCLATMAMQSIHALQVPLKCIRELDRVMKVDICNLFTVQFNFLPVVMDGSAHDTHWGHHCFLQSFLMFFAVFSPEKNVI